MTKLNTAIIEGIAVLPTACKSLSTIFLSKLTLKVDEIIRDHRTIGVDFNTLNQILIRHSALVRYRKNLSIIGTIYRYLRISERPMNY